MCFFSFINSDIYMIKKNLNSILIPTICYKEHKEGFTNHWLAISLLVITLCNSFEYSDFVIFIIVLFIEYYDSSTVI
ncbi:hypothetical protein HanPSC8_Chr13g0546241 [Helianthus annuus]|nr:hypothetical protein HanPSC8_Chr13g0546241 [Helianthus annuus]